MKAGKVGGKFKVASGEKVTIRTKNLSVGRRATASKPAKEIVPPPDPNYQYFSFIARGAPPEIEGIVLDFQFIKKPPPRGSYVVEVSGSEGKWLPAGTVRQSPRATGKTEKQIGLSFVLT